MKLNIKSIGLLIAILASLIVNISNLNAIFSDSLSNLSKEVSLMSIALADDGGDLLSLGGSTSFENRKNRISIRSDGVFCHYQCLDYSSNNCDYYYNDRNSCS